MATLVLVDFGFSAPGTVVPPVFTIQGLQVVLPAPSVLVLAQSGLGVRIETKVWLVPKVPLESVELRGGAGANAPTVRFIDPKGGLLQAVIPVINPDQSFNAGWYSGPIGMIELDFPNSEGVIHSLAGLQRVADRRLLDKQTSIERIDQSKCQAIVFAETATIELIDQGDLESLTQARRFIAGVAYKRDGEGVAKPRYPTPEELKQPFIKRAWDRCEQAAKDALDDDVGNCRHFVIWYSDDKGKTPSKSPKEIEGKWPYEQADKIKGSWGPYRVPELKRENIYVIKYCGVR
ncbi:hypothetical protein [Mesorhizobium sp. WSM1497]|uniref:hypothetical protein n=1 Tax=Mesorhizobium sp. WSM1497 TaxID=278153 RepID=UPI0007EDAD06|nr:hypothetical protein [Mesorhizobium sp. WSM1497]